MSYHTTKRSIGRDTVLVTETRVRFGLPLTTIEQDAKRVNKDFGPLHSTMGVEETRASVLRSIDNAVTKLQRYDDWNTTPDMFTVGEVQALMLLALVNETQQALTDIWRDESLSFDDAMRLESNALCRMRRAEHKYAGRALNLRDYI